MSPIVQHGLDGPPEPQYHRMEHVPQSSVWTLPLFEFDYDPDDFERSLDAIARSSEQPSSASLSLNGLLVPRQSNSLSAQTVRIPSPLNPQRSPVIDAQPFESDTSHASNDEVDRGGVTHFDLEVSAGSTLPEPMRLGMQLQPETIEPWPSLTPVAPESQPDPPSRPSLPSRTLADSFSSTTSEADDRICLAEFPEPPPIKNFTWALSSVTPPRRGRCTSLRINTLPSLASMRSLAEPSPATSSSIYFTPDPTLAACLSIPTDRPDPNSPTHTPLCSRERRSRPSSLDYSYSGLQPTNGMQSGSKGLEKLSSTPSFGSLGSLLRAIGQWGYNPKQSLIAMPSPSLPEDQKDGSEPSNSFPNRPTHLPPKPSTSPTPDESRSIGKRATIADISVLTSPGTTLPTSDSPPASHSRRQSSLKIQRSTSQLWSSRRDKILLARTPPRNPVPSSALSSVKFPSMNHLSPPASISPMHRLEEEKGDTTTSSFPSANETEDSLRPLPSPSFTCTTTPSERSPSSVTVPSTSPSFLTHQENPNYTALHSPQESSSTLPGFNNFSEGSNESKRSWRARLVSLPSSPSTSDLPNSRTPLAKTLLSLKNGPKTPPVHHAKAPSISHWVRLKSIFSLSTAATPETEGA